MARGVLAVALLAGAACSNVGAPSDAEHGIEGVDAQPNIGVEQVGPLRVVAQLGRLAGDWRAVEDDSIQEERWCAPLGGLMLGTGRTVIGGRARFLEYLRIEERPDGLVYVASVPSSK